MSKSPTQATVDDIRPMISTEVASVPSKASKRIRGEIACAECRRLKIRCDRTVPCSTCVKRGCASLCPNGTIPPGQGSRFVLAATEHLQRKLAKLEARMHSLEDALAILQSESSLPPYTSLNNVEDEDDDHDLPLKATEPTPEDPSQIHSPTSTGSIYIDETGISRFFGPSGGSESLLWNSSSSIHLSTPLQNLDSSYVPPEINYCYQTFPFTMLNVSVSSIQHSIESFLPPLGRAVLLAETFLEHLSWMFQIVSRQELIVQLIPAIYRQTKISYDPHELSLVLAVLAIGALVDLNSAPYNLESQHYYRLARAALTLQHVLTEPSIVTVKVLHLLSVYNGMSGNEKNLEQAYALLNVAGQISIQIGLHIDPALWGFRGIEAYNRRVYFWNLLQGLLWQSLVLGRPPVVLAEYIDCKIPTGEEENAFQMGEVPLGFGIWGYRATQECLLPIARITLSAKPTNYDAIVDLDKRVRNFIPPSYEAVTREDVGVALSMQVFVRSHYKDLLLLFLHRAFFAQAFTENLTDPSETLYRYSVNAAYQSACVVLDHTQQQFDKNPKLCSRVWRIWAFAFSAAVVVGTVAIHGQHLGLGPSAFPQLQSICEVFRKASSANSRVAKATVIIEGMLRRAHRNAGPIAVFGAGESLDSSLTLGEPGFPSGTMSFSPSVCQRQRYTPSGGVTSVMDAASLTLEDRWSSFVNHFSMYDQ